MIRGIKGAPDLLPEEAGRWQYVERVARDLLERYGFVEIRTPIFERTELFVRGIGEGTDIVEKEMYTFRDRGGESLTLRPEATASVVRAYLEHTLAGRGGVAKVYLIGPMFRHERPQSGRFRQFHQINVEAIGSDSPAVDAEVIALLAHLSRAWGLRDIGIQLNSIGDRACRPSYRERFKAHMEAQRAALCADCHVRLDRNPLRIMDCKTPGCQRIAAGAPRISDHLCEPCREHFARVRALLDGLKVAYVINERLVRGLDYYTRTTFEFVSPALGAQNAIAGGGRYDGLAEEIGGPPTPAIGFAIGMERVLASLPAGAGGGEGQARGVYVATVGAEAFAVGFGLAQELRERGIRTVVDLEGRGLKGQMRQADKGGYRYCLIVGSEELGRGAAILRDLSRAEQEEVPLAEVAARVATLPGAGA